jgi:acetolactate synthase-1/2/3 large subunit
MIAVVGDGTYMFSNPTACHHAGAKHSLPVLTVIANNARWNAVDSTSRLVYPDGEISKLSETAFSDLSPSPAYEQVCISSGGFGVMVEDREGLEVALRRAMEVVEVEKRQAVVNVICA